MEHAQRIELLEKTHRFPGTYTFKVIGKAETGFSARVVAAVREALAQEVDPPHSLREARGGRHVSVTVEPTVRTAEDVLAVYRRISTIVGVVMVM